MSTSHDPSNEVAAMVFDPHQVFADPVGYLAGLGIAADLVSPTGLPAAA